MGGDVEDARGHARGGAAPAPGPFAPSVLRDRRELAPPAAEQAAGPAKQRGETRAPRASILCAMDGVRRPRRLLMPARRGLHTEPRGRSAASRRRPAGGGGPWPQQVADDGGQAARRLPRAGRRPLADLLPAARSTRSRPRRTSATCRPPTPSGCRRWSRRSTASWTRSSSSRPRPGVYWTPNGHHRLKALQKLKAGLGARDPHPGAGGRLPDPGPQHREGAQPQGEVAGGHPHVPRRWPRSEPRKGEEDYTFQFEAPHLSRWAALRGEQALRGRRLRAHPEARGQVPDRHVRQDAAHARGARGEGARRRRGPRRRRWRKLKQARDPTTRS